MVLTIDPLPPRDAIAALDERGKRLDPSFAWQDRWQEEHADAFTVAKSAGFDILKDIHDGLEAALKDGTGQRAFDKRLVPLLQEKGWWGRQLVTDPATGDLVPAQLGSLRRLKTIFDVNMRVSYAAGHWANFERNKAARPFLRYVAIRDERTRPEHWARHNLCLPVDHPYWNAWAPPCGWNCRCTLQSLSQRDVDRMRDQLVFDPPPDLFRDWLNKRTGEISKVPVGIDPGWAYNPGKAGHQSALAGASKLIDAPAELAAEAAGDPDWLRRPIGEEFGGWFDTAQAGGRLEQPTVAIGAIDSTALRALADRGIRPASGAVTVDGQTMRRLLRQTNRGRGRMVPAEILRRLPSLLANPRGVLRDRRDGALLYVFGAPGNGGERIVVRLDFATAIGTADDQPESIPTNAIRSAGIVALRDLTDEAYDVLVGML